MSRVISKLVRKAHSPDAPEKGKGCGSQWKDEKQILMEMISRNDVAGVTSRLERDEKLLKKYPDLLKFARSHEMVRELLQLNKFQKCRKGENSNDQRSDCVREAIKTNFTRLATQWPEVLEEAMTLFISYEGYCKEDSALKVVFDFSLFAPLDQEGCQRMKRPVIEDFQTLNGPHPKKLSNILLHPLTLSFLHLNYPSSAIHRWGSIVLLFVTTLFTVHLQFTRGRNLHCGKKGHGDNETHTHELIEGDFTEFTFTDVILFFLWQLSFYLVAGTYIAIQILLLCRMRMRYVYGRKLQFHLVPSLLILPFSNLFAFEDFNLQPWLLINASLAANVNFFHALSSSPVLGKYVLMISRIVKTMCKLLFLFGIIMNSIVTINFVLRNPQVIKFYAVKLDKDDLTRAHKEGCAAQFPLVGEVGKWQKDFLIKSMFVSMNYLFGDSNPDHATENMEEMAQPFTEIDPKLAIFWLFAALLTVVLFMNFFISVIIGDVKSVAKEARCEMVLIQMYELECSIVYRDVVKLLKLRKTQTVQCPKYFEVYPNLYQQGCALEKRDGFWQRLKMEINADHVLGCKKVNKSILANFDVNKTYSLVFEESFA